MELGWFILGLISGIVCGSLAISLWYDYKKPYGTLRIDHSNPSKDIYRFEIDDFEDLHNRDRIILDVDNKADLSQK